MLGGHSKFLVLKLVLVLVVIQLIITVNNSTPAAAANEHGDDQMKLSTDTSGFLSIDCGASGDYIDNETGLFYESDKKYIDMGEIKEIFPNFTPEIHKQQAKSLRSFPQGTRNCYKLKPKQGANNNYLIRAIFFYGNYDSKNQLPVFDLYLGVNRWTTVYGELRAPVIIHVPTVEYIDVCLVNIGNGVPYISALEIRPLDNSIYRIKDGALSTIGMLDIGGQNNFTRYPVDVYDRIWLANPPNFNDWITISTQSTLNIQSFDDAYKLPAEVLKTAARTKNASIPLNLNYYSSSGPTSQYYLYLHFAEIEKLKDGQKRELRININGVRNVTQSLRLEYLQPLTIAPNDPPINGTQLDLSIYAVQGSNLPPILNALEAFMFLELPLSPTNLNDVNAIMEIKQMYKVTRNWRGDPCVPSSFSWDGLNCSNDTIPRIVSLNLSSNKLTGEIPISLLNLEAIILLDLSYNNLTGPVPEFLAELPNLKVLNLTGNKLSGSVPEALQGKSKDGTLLLSLENNPDICLSVSCHEKKTKFIIPVLGSIIALLVILLAFAALAMYKRERKAEVTTGPKKEGSLKSKNRPFTYSGIVSITNNFKTIVGEGGFGKVYLGNLKDGTEVAVKVLSLSSRQGYKEFRAEAQLLMIVHHRNLVSLIGYCDDHENKALIYEYMVHGNLRQHLLETDTNTLSWSDRLQIAVDAAHGLDYLHNGCKPPTIHRDLKPSNILLNESMQAKLADFGLSRFIYKESDSRLTTCPAGTPGYIDPEFYASGRINKKSDVYSFGIILLELITGQPAIKRGLEIDRYILQRVTPVIERGDIQNLVDPRLQEDFNTTAAWKMVEIAMSCVLPTSFQRPDMSYVLAELKECLTLEMDPRRTGNTENNKISSSNLLEEVFFEPGMQIAPITR